MWRDARGEIWDTAQDALDSFIADLPDMSEEETESVFQFTDYQATPEANLAAISHGITYSGMDDRFGGDNYPVPAEIPPGAYGIVAVNPLLTANENALTCGECGLSWLEDITPSGRCPWEELHTPEESGEIHVSYPHPEGYLYDCPACEASCHCTPGAAECIFDGEHNAQGVA